VAVFANWLLAQDLTVDDSGVVLAGLAESIEANLFSLGACSVDAASLAWPRLGVWEALHASAINEYDLLWVVALWLLAFLPLGVWSGELSASLAGAVW
jgi:hypothetical protein